MDRVYVQVMNLPSWWDSLDILVEDACRKGVSFQGGSRTELASTAYRGMGKQNSGKSLLWRSILIRCVVYVFVLQFYSVKPRFGSKGFAAFEENWKRGFKK